MPIATAIAASVQSSPFPVRAPRRRRSIAQTARARKYVARPSQ